MLRLVEVVRERVSTTHSLGFTEHELEVYEERFHAHMTPRAFSRLLKRAEWREVGSAGALVTGPQECGYLLRGSAALQVVWLALVWLVGLGWVGWVGFG